MAVLLGASLVVTSLAPLLGDGLRLLLPVKGTRILGEGVVAFLFMFILK